MSNIFKQFHDYQSRNVDHPSYEPLEQPILKKTPTNEEVRKAKRREYLKEYYEKNKEKMREYQREYHRKYYNKMPQKNGLKGVQLSVYNYMIEQYQLWDRVPRATQIAKALDVGEQTVYNATAALVKKGYIGRGALGRYYLINPPIKEENEVKKELEVMGESFDEPEMVSKKPKKHIDGEDYSPGYVGQLKHSIRLGQKIINGMREEIESLNKRLEDKELELQNSGSKDDEYKSNLISRLENQNAEMKVEIEELKSAIKTLSRYID